MSVLCTHSSHTINLRRFLDKEGAVVIMCNTTQKTHYEQLAAGTTVIESSLHLALSEHLNSEISLGTITNIETAKRWLRSTFLFQRIRRNPKHYGIGKEGDQTWEARFDNLVATALKSLEKSQLIVVEDDETLSATERESWRLLRTSRTDAVADGLNMSRTYVKQASMDLFLALPEKCTKRELVSYITRCMSRTY